MEIINLIINNPISVIAISAIGLFIFVAKRNITINEDRAFYKSLAENKDKELNSALAKIDMLKKEHEDAISSINQANHEEVAKLQSIIVDHNKKTPDLKFDSLF